MVIVVLLIDVLLWKPLTAWAEKFRITQNESVQDKTSLVLSILRRSGISDALALVGRPIADLMFWLTRPLGRTGARWPAAGTRRRTLDIAFMALMAVACLAGLWMLGRFISDGEGFAEVGHAMVLGLITFMRVTLLTVVCSIIWVPIGVKIGMNPRISRFVQPLVQVLASFPSNFTFPFVTLWFIAWHIDISWGSILLMSLGTQWYILFNVIAGASAIPDDLREATRAFHLDTRQRWTKLILPAVFGSWCTGGITAAGGAWNASIVSDDRGLRAHHAYGKWIGNIYRQCDRGGRHRQDHHRGCRDERVRRGRQPAVLASIADVRRAPFLRRLTETAPAVPAHRPATIQQHRRRAHVIRIRRDHPQKNVTARTIYHDHRNFFRPHRNLPADRRDERRRHRDHRGAARGQDLPCQAR